MDKKEYKRLWTLKNKRSCMLDTIGSECSKEECKDTEYVCACKACEE
jgi:hypothetical protein